MNKRQIKKFNKKLGYKTYIQFRKQESEIIQLSMAIRTGQEISNFQGKEVQILSKEELNTGMLEWADQILVATNATRTTINNQMRQMLN